MNTTTVTHQCTFCKKNLEHNPHILHATTGKIVTSQIDQIKRVDPTTVQQTITTQYADTKDHSYALCNNCWTNARIRILLLLSSPLILLLLFLIGNFALNIQILTTDMAAIIIISLMVLLWVIGIPYARSHEPWHRLKKMAVQERGGAPFVVFAGSKENSTFILPV